MSDVNAPSWLTAPETAPSSVPRTATAAEKAAKSGGVFSIFAKETSTAKVPKTTTHEASSPSKNVMNAPDDGFTPAWAVAKAFTSPKDVESGNTPVTAEEKGPIPLDLDPALLKRMRFYHWILRSAYMTASIIMGTAAGYSLILQTNISAAFFAIYVMFFCLIMCCFEVGLNFISSTIAVNFGFLYTLTGRMIFLLFVGIMSYSLSIFGKAAMAILFLVGLFHAVLMCVFPKFSEYVRQKDFYGSKSQK